MVWPNLAMMCDELPWAKKSIRSLVEAMLAGGCQDSPDKLVERAAYIEKEIKARDEKTVQDVQARLKIEEEKERAERAEQIRKETENRKRQEEMIAQLVAYDPEVVTARNASLLAEQGGKADAIRKAKAKLTRAEENARIRIRGVVAQY